MGEEQKQAAGRARPEIRGKVLAVMDEWHNNAGTFWKREVVVETGLRFPNPLKVTFQKDAVSHLEGVAEGDCVIIPYVLNGREYEGRYYVDVVGMGLQKVFGSGGASGGTGGGKKPILGCTASTAIETWAKHHGSDDKAGFAAFCKALKPGKASKEYTVGDWADVANAIEKAAAEKAAAERAAAEKLKAADEAAALGATDPDDLPF